MYPSKHDCNCSIILTVRNRQNYHLLSPMVQITILVTFWAAPSHHWLGLSLQKLSPRRTFHMLLLPFIYCILYLWSWFSWHVFLLLNVNSLRSSCLFILFSFFHLSTQLAKEHMEGNCSRDFFFKSWNCTKFTTLWAIGVKTVNGIPWELAQCVCCVESCSRGNLE